MFKNLIVLMILFLFLCSCERNDVFYSSVLETNHTAIYQFKEENIYISQYPNSYVFQSIDEIECDNFTAILIDEVLGELSSNMYEQILSLMHSNNKITLIYFNSNKIKYLEPKVRINFNSMTGLVGTDIISYELHGNKYTEPKLLYIAQSCFMVIGGGIVDYMKFQ